VHQNRGLNPHIEDIARRLAVAGYNALAVDFLSQLGGSPKDEDAAMTMYAKLDNAKVTGDANAAVTWLKARPESNGKVGAIGFCWGGGVINQMAVTNPELNAADVYYGAPPAAAEVPKIKAKMLLNYADPKLDTRLGGMLPDFEKALKDAKVDYKLYTYEGANHAFNDDSQKARYDEKAAKTAWDRTTEFFKANLA
jgi:carboxymethylenebutenolidase